MTVLQKAPNVVVVCATVLVGVTIVCVAALIALGKNPGQVETIVATLLQGAGVLVGSGAFLYAGAAARSSSNAESQLNGALDAKIRTAITETLLAHDIEVHGAAPTVPPPPTSASP